MRKALVVGIDNYPGCPLQGCRNDSEAIEDLLANNENGDPNFSVFKKDDVPTKGDLREHIRKCFDGDCEVALFYYSGHGYIDSVGGYLVTPDYSPNDWGVSLDEVLAIANQSKCRERIIILDSCYSGQMGNIKTSGQNTAVINEGVTILSACREFETSMEIDGHGVFTSLLVEALKGGAADITGAISAGGIYAFIDKALGPWEQRPVFKTNVSHFTSIRKVTPQVDIKTIRRLAELFTEEYSEVQLDPSFEPTNTPGCPHEVVEPYAKQPNTETFSVLQKLEGIGLVVPTGEEHMYYAAMNSGSCHLTPMGKQYWRLVKDGKI